MSDLKIVVYTSNNCSNCNELLARLSEWEVDYEERNINKHREYFKELQKQKVYGTPATFINNEVILGYQKRKLEQTLGVGIDERFFESELTNHSTGFK